MTTAGPQNAPSRNTDLAVPRYRVVSRDEWLEARVALLAKEKEFSKLHDQLSLEQRALPWVRVEKDYIFGASEGNVTLAQLFEGRSQLFIKHFMMGPGQAHQCVGCSFEVDHVAGILATSKIMTSHTQRWRARRSKK